ncbi:alpha-L-fucosidase [Paenibacillus arenilitoris]|uniref:alpha-L-fucosidase n=1 Tax=Paenibacillus arenilitoris TaxID=2772299 RepID=A0A927CL20_9BACL|nr:alpha-L-fucosidase [Paenibacillus arenilitoris]MBD2870043.1 alpha-L-fucosidase [Paenibacillus arenilitoris]
MTEKDRLLDGEQEANAQAVHAHDLECKPEPDRRLGWWREARLGLFIHWGLYSLPAGIWNGEELKGAYGEHLMLRAKIPVKDYEAIAGRFNPLKFDAEQWVQAAKSAGLNYLVFTAKHHDGFAMYDSEVSDYNIVRRTPFGHDPLAELAEACRRHGIVPCIYYSHAMDWHHPDSQGNTWDYPGNIGAYEPAEEWIRDEDKSSRFEKYLEEKAMPQIRELLTRYGPIGVLWFDCGHKLTEAQGRRFLELVRSIQPDCLVNRRVWKEPLGDYGNTSDNQPHVRIPRQDWESIATMNDSWGYKINDHNWKTPSEILRQLIDTVSMNGNYVINVGPTGDGEFDSESLARLHRLGTWLQTNGDSIYGTVRSPIGKPPWGRCTMKGQRLFLHIFDGPLSGQLVIPGIRNELKTVYALADPERKPLLCRRLSDIDWIVDLSGAPQDHLAAVIVAEFLGDLDSNPVKLLVEDDYPNVFGAFECDIVGSTLRFDTGKQGRDNVTDWSEGDLIRWKFRTIIATAFRIRVAYGADASCMGGEFEVAVGDQKRSAKVTNTGGMHAFRDFEIGTVDIPAGGPFTLTVKAVSIPEACLMNLQKVVLVPASSYVLR